MILRAYRLGRVFRPRAPHLGPAPSPPPRQILVTFSQPVEVDFIMSSAHKLKGSKIGLSRDYPKEISDARKALWSRYKEARAQYGPKSAKILYPAALQVNGKITHNLFPDWFETLRGSRNVFNPKRVADRVQVHRDRFMEQIKKDSKGTDMSSRPGPVPAPTSPVEIPEDRSEIMSIPSSPKSDSTNHDDHDDPLTVPEENAKRVPLIKGPLFGKHRTSATIYKPHESASEGLTKASVDPPNVNATSGAADDSG